MRRSLALLLLASCALPLSLPLAAHAAGVDTPLFPEDPNPSFSEESMKEGKTYIVGSFGVIPSASAGVDFTDNVRFSNGNEDSDVVVGLDAAVTAASVWRTHELKGTAYIKSDTYLDSDSENTVDAGLLGSGRFDFSPYTNVSGELAFQRGHDPRYQRVVGNDAVEPVEYDVTTAKIAYTATGNMLKYYAGAGIRKFDASDVGRTDGTLYDQDYRDSERTFAEARVDYRITPVTSLFVNYQINQVEFDDKTVNRDSDGYTLRAGAAFYLSELLTGDIQVGYMKQDYKNPAFSSVKGASYLANLNYMPTRLTTIVFNARRSIEEAPAINASGYFLNMGQLMLKHELTRRLNLGIGYELSKYEYNGIDREDTYNGIYMAGLYEITRKLTLEVSFRNRDYESTGANAFTDPKYTENRIGVAVKASF